MLMTLVDNDQDKTSYLVIVLEKDNLERMRHADPMTLETRARGGRLPVAKYPEALRILVGYEEDEETLWKMGQRGNFGEMIEYLTRGWEFRQGIDGTEHAFSLRTGADAASK